MNYLDMTKEEKFKMQKLMLHHYSNEAIAEGLSDEDARDMMVYELSILEEDEKFEECALLRDVIKIWDDLK